MRRLVLHKYCVAFRGMNGQLCNWWTPTAAGVLYYYTACVPAMAVHMFLYTATHLIPSSESLIQNSK